MRSILTPAEMRDRLRSTTQETLHELARDIVNAHEARAMDDHDDCYKFFYADECLVAQWAWMTLVVSDWLRLNCHDDAAA